MMVLRLHNSLCQLRDSANNISPSLGLSAATLLLYNGDILGASGITSSVLLNPKKALTDPSQHWKLVLLASFLLASNLIFPTGYSEAFSGVSYLAYAIGGFFVGFGTKLGNGCTSGHGICGLARRSKRSLVSVLTFMTVGVSTASLISSSIMKDLTDALRTSSRTMVPLPYVGAAVTALVFVEAIMEPALASPKQRSQATSRSKLFPAAVAGALFALGLSLSGMVHAHKLFGFLDLTGFSDGTYDPTLMTVMAAGMLVSFISYQFVDGFNVVKHSKCLPTPMCDCKFSVPTNQIVDWQLVVGAMNFGFGWAIAGLCPGPALVHAAVGSTGPIVYWWPAFYVGSYMAQKVKSKC